MNSQHVNHISELITVKTKIESSLRFDVILICGPYKTGTSLLAKLIGQYGYFNPSSVTNPSEHGYSSNQDRYYTAECKIAREINKNIINTININGSINPINFQKSIFSEISNYIKSFTNQLIIKDPQFVFTLPYWILVARSLNKSTFVAFTYRDYDSLQHAWYSAPYTKNKLAEDPNCLSFMKIMCDYQIKFCFINSISSVLFNHYYLTMYNKSFHHGKCIY